MRYPYAQCHPQETSRGSHGGGSSPEYLGTRARVPVGTISGGPSLKAYPLILPQPPRSSNRSRVAYPETSPEGLPPRGDKHRETEGQDDRPEGLPREAQPLHERRNTHPETSRIQGSGDGLPRRGRRARPNRWREPPPRARGPGGPRAYPVEPRGLGSAHRARTQRERAYPERRSLFQG